MWRHFFRKTPALFWKIKKSARFEFFSEAQTNFFLLSDFDTFCCFIFKASRSVFHAVITDW